MTRARSRWVTRSDGALEFDGHDLRAFGTAGHEYEYVVRVPATQFAAVRGALGVEADAELLAELVAHADDIMPTGEVAWLRRNGIEHEVSVWDRRED